MGLDQRPHLRLDFGRGGADPVTGMLEIAHDVSPAIELIHRVQTGRLAARRDGHDARQLLGVDVVGPQEVVDMLTAVFADEERAHSFRKLEVVGVGHLVGVGGIAQGVRGNVLPGQQGFGVGRHPFAVDGHTLVILETGLQAQGHDGARLEQFGHRNAIAGYVQGVIDHHGLFDVLERRVSHLVIDVDGGAFHLGEAHAGANIGCIAMGLQESSGFFHAWLELDPFHLAVGHDAGESGIRRVCAGNRENIRGLDAVVHQLADFRTAGRAQLDPAQGGCGRIRVQ